MGLSEVRNHANLILNIIRLITKKENFYDVKNEVMESVRSVIPCEKISIIQTIFKMFKMSKLGFHLLFLYK